ncbi:MAG: hypothetical protein ACO1QB_18560 [Verrucomicrobiales bacterium]
MAWFKKKDDPISVRSRELNAKLAALQSEIKQLDAKVHHRVGNPRVRSTALPHGPILTPPPSPPTHEPIFESAEPARDSLNQEIESTAAHYNDMGVRKYDLLAAFRRIQKHFRGPPASNPKLISYLAAGSIKGLRPLRYEKRIARNRFIFLSIFFVFVLWGILYVIFNHR